MTQTAVRACRHHWVLTEPRDDVIHAVCKRCRATRRYPARLEMTERFDDYQELLVSEPLPPSLCHAPSDEW